MEAVAIEEQLAGVSGDRLRVLIVGAGVAGSTLARLLRNEGLHPVVIEKSAPGASGGYVLGLLPLVDSVMDRLGVLADFHRRSTVANRYVVRGRRGTVLREYDLSRVFGSGKGYRWIERGDLLELIGSGAGSVTFDTLVDSVDDKGGTVEVTLRSRDADRRPPATTAHFDLVVGADGMHSAVRGAVQAGRVGGFRSNVSGWVAWIDELDSPRVEEIWGAGFFVGAYPAPGRTCVFVGGPSDELTNGPAGFAHAVHHKLGVTSPVAMAALEAVERNQCYLWRMEDCRADHWTAGRVVLVGDAAVGFLPTAGVGAAIAIEAAGKLAAAVSRSSQADVTERLVDYETAQRPRAEAAQRDSRGLARMMFVDSGARTLLRDIGIRITPAAAATRNVRKLIRTTGR